MVIVVGVLVVSTNVDGVFVVVASDVVGVTRARVVAVTVVAVLVVVVVGVGEDAVVVTTFTGT
jgi:hypothetical protein